MSLINEEFPEEVEPKVDEITIPADVTPENIPTQIVDFSVQEQRLDEALLEVEKADAVCLVFAVDNGDSLDDLDDVWLPLIASTVGKDMTPLPTILVANKIDLVEVTEVINNVSNGYVLCCFIQYRDVCSAKGLLNLSEIFYFAQKSVLHPLAPLFDVEEASLSELCKRALTRVFSLCDKDRDGWLCDSELSFFQRYCFKNPLHRQGLSEIKQVIQKGLPDNVTSSGINLQGFLYLQKLFIMKGHQETVWTILRKFGYDNKLNISEQYLTPEDDISVGCFVQLSPSAITFLKDIFYAYDKDNDGYLNDAELTDLYSMCQPFGFLNSDFEVCSTNKYGHPNLEGFISLYALFAMNDFRFLYGQFTMLGFGIGENNSRFSAFQAFSVESLLSSRILDKRSTFVCKLFGAQGCGKSTLLYALLANNKHRKSNDIDNFSEEIEEIVLPIKVKNRECYLIIQEAEWDITNYLLTSDFYDVAIFLIDSTQHNSMVALESYIKIVHNSAGKLVLGSKSDLACQSEKGLMNALNYCISNNLRPYQKLNLKNIPDEECAYLLNDIGLLCVNGTCKEKTFELNCWKYVKIGIFASLILLLGYTWHKTKA